MEKSRRENELEFYRNSIDYLKSKGNSIYSQNTTDDDLVVAMRNVESPYSPPLSVTIISKNENELEGFTDKLIEQIRLQKSGKYIAYSHNHSKMNSQPSHIHLLAVVEYETFPDIINKIKEQYKKTIMTTISTIEPKNEMEAI